MLQLRDSTLGMVRCVGGKLQLTTQGSQFAFVCLLHGHENILLQWVDVQTARDKRCFQTVLTIN